MVIFRLLPVRLPGVWLPLQDTPTASPPTPKGSGHGHTRTSMMGSWPLIPTLMCVFFNSTTKSRALRFPGMGTTTSASSSVCVHLYGSFDCSSSSLLRSSVSLRPRSDGVGDGSRCSDMLDVLSRAGRLERVWVWLGWIWALGLFQRQTYNWGHGDFYILPP